MLHGCEFDSLKDIKKRSRDSSASHGIKKDYVTPGHTGTVAAAVNFRLTIIIRNSGEMLKDHKNIMLRVMVGFSLFWISPFLGSP